MTVKNLLGCIYIHGEKKLVPCTWNSQSVTHMSNNDCETRKFKCLTLDNVHALPIKYSCV